jgi:hypothetical protein
MNVPDSLMFAEKDNLQDAAKHPETLKNNRK